MNSGRDKSIFEAKEGVKSFEFESWHTFPRYLTAVAAAKQAILRLSPAKSVILDLGCGLATNAKHLIAETLFSYFGIDKSRYMIKRARKLLYEAGLVDRASLMQADLLKLETIQKPKDLIELPDDHLVAFSSFVFHHFTASEKMSIYEALQSRWYVSPLILVDLFENSGTLEGLGLQVELADIAKLTNKLNTEESQSLVTLTDQHYAEENTPGKLFDEIELLKTAGYTTTDLLYRAGQVAVLVCR